MRFRFYAFFVLLISLGELAIAQAPPGASGPAADVKYELNMFYGQTLGISPTLINQKIDDLNSGATVQMRSIEKTTLRGGEFLSAFSKGTLIGIRFTTQGAQTTEGSESGSVNQVSLAVDDLSAVIKFKFDLLGLTWNAGGTGGVSVVNDLTINDAGTISKYSSPGGMVMRGFLGTQLTLSFLSLWGEAGYQLLNDKSYRRADGVKPTSTGGDVTLDLTGPYALVGIGFRY